MTFLRTTSEPWEGGQTTDACVCKRIGIAQDCIGVAAYGRVRAKLRGVLQAPFGFISLTPSPRFDVGFVNSTPCFFSSAAANFSSTATRR